MNLEQRGKKVFPVFIIFVFSCFLFSIGCTYEISFVKSISSFFSFITLIVLLFTYNILIPYYSERKIELKKYLKDKPFTKDFYDYYKVIINEDETLKDEVKEDFLFILKNGSHKQKVSIIKTKYEKENTLLLKVLIRDLSFNFLKYDISLNQRLFKSEELKLAVIEHIKKNKIKIERLKDEKERKLLLKFLEQF